MRPLELRLRNFRSYGDEPSVFDFRGRRLVGVVGPIGSGKSSILDGIAFSLYGKTPSLSRGTKSLIHQRADGCVVTFRFSVDDEVWEVVRALRRKGQSQHILYRLSSDTADADKVETINLEADVNARIVDLLGLEFDAFTRSVLLAQGRFSEFLRAAPAERDVVLKGLFGHERIDVMRQIAKDRVAALDLELARGESEAANLDALRQRSDTLEEEVEALTERRTVLQEALPAHNDDLELVGILRREIQVLTGRLRGLSTAARPNPEEVASLSKTAAAAEELRAEIAIELTAAEAALAAVGSEVTANAESRANTTEALSILEERRLHHRRLSDLKEAAGKQRADLEVIMSAVTDVESRLQSAAAAADTAEGRLIGAREGVQAAEKMVQHQQAADMAGTLRHELEDGEPCPVCARPVEIELLDAVPPVALEEAWVQLEDAQARLAEAEVAAQAALSDRTRLETELAHGNRRVGEVQEEIDIADRSVAEQSEAITGLEKTLASILGPGDPEELIQGRKEAIKALDQKLEQARAHRDAIRVRHDEAILAEQQANKQLGATQLILAELAGKLELDGGEVPSDPVSHVGAMLQRLDDAINETSKSVETTQQDLAVVEERMAERIEELAVQGPLVDAIGRLDGQLQTATLELESLAERIVATTEMLKGRDAKVQVRDTYVRIAADLSTANFVRYLLDAERQRLAELGSEHFQRLSAGRYRFDTDGSFNVIDLTAADAIRKPDSLSGGETFLASLGLALALAELVGRTGGRLDAFFLDEGFGSLDPEHLDLAMDGIEAVAAGTMDRLVLVVSHVAELRERLEDLIQLDRDPVSGNTRVMRA